MGRSSVRLLSVMMALTVLVSPDALAQSNDLITQLPAFYYEGIEVEDTGQQNDFRDPTKTLGAATSMIALMSAVAAQASTYPIGSSSGGLTYIIDDQGLARRATETFGPILGERAITLGRKQFNVGVSIIPLGYDSVEGLSLEDGDLQWVMEHAETPTAPTYGDIITTQVSMKLSVDQALLFMNYGATEKLDVGVVLPFVSVDMDAAVGAFLERLGTGQANEAVNRFAVPSPPASSCQSQTSTRCTATFGGSESGIGDLRFRAKYNVLGREHTDLAIYGDLRLPTGDEQNLLGLGATQVRGLFVASWNLMEKRLTPYADLGYTASFGDYSVEVDPQTAFKVEPSDEVNFAAGLQWAPIRRLTLTGEVGVRRYLDTTTIKAEATPFEYRQSGGPIQTAQRVQITPVQRNVDSSVGSIGLKFLVGRSTLLNGALLVPLAQDQGLQPDLSGYVGVEFNFGG